MDAGDINSILWSVSDFVYVLLQLSFIEYSLCVRHFVKLFTYMLELKAAVTIEEVRLMEFK